MSKTLNYAWELGNQKITLRVDGLFLNDGTPSITMVEPDGEDFGDLTVSLPVPLSEGCVFLDHNFGKDKLKFVEENNLGEFVGTVTNGFAKFACVKINLEELKKVVSGGKEFLDQWAQATH